MATYVMSDLHGEYGKYCRMLELIGLSVNDDMFILGDVDDRGPEPVRILQDMMVRPNIFPIMGNHDLMALDVLSKLSVDITSENAASQLDVTAMNELIDWLYEGGRSTMEAFQKLSRDERAAVLDYMSDFSLYEVIDVGERTFILVHAGLGGFRADKELSEYTRQELLMDRHDPDVRYFDDDSVFIVTGHTPTPYYCGKPEIYHSHNNICIDCGACSSDGKLACLCLDTMQEFYV
jgi:serine/threonine protein phosphatase 1